MLFIRFLLTVMALICVCGAVQAKDKNEVGDLGKQPFEAAFASGGHLRITLRSGDIRIEGADAEKISIRADGKNADRASEVKIRLVRKSDGSELEISGGPRNGIEIVVEIPRKTNLWVRMPAGELDVHGVIGDKDVELHAGDLTISAGDPEQYAHADASVTSGSLDADRFGVSKGGLFRSFNKSGSGSLHLHAHVGAGQLTLE